MSRRYPPPYPPRALTPYDASQRSSSTSYSQEPSWPTSSGSTSRTYYNSQGPRYYPSTSAGRTLFADQRPNSAPRSSAVTAAQPRPQLNPAYGVSSYQASLAGSGARAQQDSFEFGRPELIPGGSPAPPPPPPPPSPSQYQQPRDAYANPSVQRRSSRSFGQFFKDLASPKRRKFVVDGFEAGSPPLPSRVELVPDGRRGRDSVPRSFQYPNVGSNVWGGRLEGEPKLPQAFEEFGQWTPQANAQSSSRGNGPDFNPYYYRDRR